MARRNPSESHLFFNPHDICPERLLRDSGFTLARSGCPSFVHVNGPEVNIVPREPSFVLRHGGVSGFRPDDERPLVWEVIVQRNLNGHPCSIHPDCPPEPSPKMVHLGWHAELTFTVCLRPKVLAVQGHNDLTLGERCRSSRIFQAALHAVANDGFPGYGNASGDQPGNGEHKQDEHAAAHPSIKAVVRPNPTHRTFPRAKSLRMHATMPFPKPSAAPLTPS
ncbi:hypothetical protein SDC9_131677 [bioreactor metagenome]|uniref:Uncharacterized protein n=1 Tax=bioreactor metagenome TaxID=1076179 RepID=A0A645D5L0_9ZZZZ